MTSTQGSFKLGILVGLIAYFSVALFYMAFDLLAARGTLFTVHMLGTAVFKGHPDPSVLLLPLQHDPGVIFWYNALHLVASLVIGQIVVKLIQHGENHPGRGPVVLAVILAGFVATVLVVGWFSTTMRPVLPWWSIIVANSLASLACTILVLKARPDILDYLLGRPRLQGGQS